MTAKSPEPGRTPIPHGIAATARRSLAHAGVETLEQLAELGGRRLAGLHGVCPRTLAQLEDAMEERGLSFPAG